MGSLNVINIRQSIFVVDGNIPTITVYLASLCLISDDVAR